MKSRSWAQGASRRGRRRSLRLAAVVGTGVLAACAGIASRYGARLLAAPGGDPHEFVEVEGDDDEDVAAAPEPALLDGSERAGLTYPWDFAPLPAVPAQRISDGQWIANGPSPTLGGQSLNTGNQVGGAINALAAHPTNPDILYIGAVNGGVWRTDNATSTAPMWRPLTDAMPSLSTGALGLDATNPDIVIYGLGRFGSFGRMGGALNGLLRSPDGGKTWTPLAAPVLRGENISGVASRGAVILATSFGATAGLGVGGVFRSSDTGATFAAVGGAPGSGLPVGAASDLVGDPSSVNRFYAALPSIGIFRSDDLGATWKSITDGDQSGLLQTIQGQLPTDAKRNLRMSTSSNGRLYVNVVVQGFPAYIGYTDNQGTGFVRMDVPMIPGPNNQPVRGLNPGAQGNIHTWIAADQKDPQIVYAGGDRSVGAFIGSNGTDGNIFRGDSRQPRAAAGAQISPQWAHEDHMIVTGLPQGGTANNTATHADHRDGTVDARGDLIDGDDGGVYRRTRPQDNQGDWSSLIGNLQITEFHDIAYDTVGNVVIGGAQDNGVPGQQQPGNVVWRSLSGGDGGDVEVDDISMPGRSLRYLSSQNLGGVRRSMFDANNTAMGSTALQRNVVQGAVLAPQFVTPIGINAIDGTRLVIGAANGVYESLDRGDNLTQLGGATTANSEATLVYGHRQNTGFLAVAQGNLVLTRAAANATALTPTAQPFPGQRVIDLAVDPANLQVIYAIDATDVYRTTDGGGSWQKITGDLATFNVGPLSALGYIEAAAGDRVLVGTNAGVFVSLEQKLGSWARLGSGLPNARVFDLDYDPTDDLLVAGTLGRGSYLLRGASQLRIPAMN